VVGTSQTEPVPAVGLGHRAAEGRRPWRPPTTIAASRLMAGHRLDALEGGRSAPVGGFGCVHTARMAPGSRRDPAALGERTDGRISARYQADAEPEDDRPLDQHVDEPAAWRGPGLALGQDDDPVAARCAV